jgi:hypothetical protein
MAGLVAALLLCLLMLTALALDWQLSDGQLPCPQQGQHETP